MRRNPWEADVSSHRLRRLWHTARHALPVGAVGLSLALLLSLVLAGTASAHADLVRSDPKADTILQAPPSQVRLWFSEAINPLTSKVVVIDPTNRQVDRGDSHVSPANDEEMDVSLPLLPAGTYIVDWRAQSADDGHVSGGSFIFRIARPDGSVPPLPTHLPTGRFPGAAGSGVPGGATIDPPTALQGLGTFLALLFMTFWVGGVIWETWILNPAGLGSRPDPDLGAAARFAARRFARLAPYALGGLLVADVVMLLGQTAELSGTLTGAVSPVLLGAILFGSRFGTFWWLRQLVALIALVLTAITLRRTESIQSAEGSEVQAPAPTGDEMRDETATRREQHTGSLNGQTGRDARNGHVVPMRPIPDWRRELVGVLRGVPHLPRRLARGWRCSSRAQRGACILAAALLVAFALSGHAAAVPASEFGYAIGVDLFHLLCEAVWIGGLFYISIVLVPALGGLPALSRARVLALGLPEFGGVAIVSAVLLAATGSLNTTIRLTSITQFLTTAYGKTLAVKIELFLVMVAISAYHAFVLRPRLATALRTINTNKGQGGNTAGAAVSGAHETPVSEVVNAAEGAEAQRQAEHRLIGVSSSATPSAHPPSPAISPPPVRAADASGGGDGDDRPHSAQLESGAADAAPTSATQAATGGGDKMLPAPARALEERLRDWLRREALLGSAVLLCVALLGIFAGSLAAPVGPAGGTGAGAAGNSGPFVQTHKIGGYAVTLKVTPGTFGRNDFTVTLKNAQAQPMEGATVSMELTDEDMDMGVQNAQLQPVGTSAPGSYTGQADLTMAGHWHVAVKVLLPNAKQPLTTDFRFTATY